MTVVRIIWTSVSRVLTPVKNRGRCDRDHTDRLRRSSHERARPDRAHGAGHRRCARTRPRHGLGPGRRRRRRHDRRRPRRRRREGAELLGAGHGFVHLDVTDDASWEAAVAAVVRARRSRHPRQQRRHRDLQPGRRPRPRRLRTMLDVNIVGTALGIKHGLPGDASGRRRPASGGRSSTSPSVAATIAFPGIAGYSATKSAVDRLTRVAAMESGKLGYGVRVNCVYPGLVPTEMGAGPRRRHGAGSACSPRPRRPSAPSSS